MDTQPENDIVETAAVNEAITASEAITDTEAIATGEAATDTNAKALNLPQLSVGKQLSEARIKQGLSIGDVAGRIKFAPRQVEALEADDFGRLPELAFVRGFVRSYARLLHLDEVALLNTLPQSSSQAGAQKSVPEVLFPTAQSARRINVIWLSAALGLAVILGISVLVVHEKPVPKKLAVTMPEADSAQVAMREPVASAVEIASSVVATPTVPQPVVVPAQVVAPKAAPASAVVAVVSPVASKVPSIAVVPKEKIATKSAEKSPVNSPVKSPEKLPVKPSVKSPIHLVFRSESWVDIKDKFGKTVFKQVNGPGSEQWVDGRPPFSVVIGNASGVRLYYEGEEIELKEFTDVEVARLILE